MDVLFWNFLLFGFLGFVLEVLYARLTHGPKRDRKCHLVLPVCPVYGLGALAILALAHWLRPGPVALFVLGGLAATASEWVMGLFYERAGRCSFWDYRSLPCNLGGRVCLLFSGAWGVLALVLVYAAAPHLAFLGRIPLPVTAAVLLCYLWDAAASLVLLRRGGTPALRWYDRVFTASSAQKASR